MFRSNVCIMRSASGEMSTGDFPIGDFFNYLLFVKIIFPLILSFLFFKDESFVRCAMTPFAEADRYCIWWLNDYFETVGDSAPNADEISLNMGTRMNQYKTYYRSRASDDLSKYLYIMYSVLFISLISLICLICLTGSSSSLSSLSSALTNAKSALFDIEVDSSESDDENIIPKTVPLRDNIVTYQRFCELWRTVFPNAVNRPYRSIMGKCKTCQLIDEGKKKSDNSTTVSSIYI